MGNHCRRTSRITNEGIFAQAVIANGSKRQILPFGRGEPMPARGRRRARREDVDPDGAGREHPAPRKVAHRRLARAVDAECRRPRAACDLPRQDHRGAVAEQRQRLFCTVNTIPFTLPSKVRSKWYSVTSSFARPLRSFDHDGNQRFRSVCARCARASRRRSNRE